MPAKEIDRLFREHKLHSGGSGKIVTNPRQATAIKLSYLRKEGHEIPLRSRRASNHSEKIVRTRARGGR